jgi:hypothetical protein
MMALEVAALVAPAGGAFAWARSAVADAVSKKMDPSRIGPPSRRRTIQTIAILCTI